MTSAKTTKKDKKVSIRKIRQKYTEKPPEIDSRRGTAVKLLPDTHTLFRMMLIKRNLSMQEVIQALAQRCVLEEPYMVRLLDDLCVKKRERVYEKMSSTDAASIYEILERESPLK